MESKYFNYTQPNMPSSTRATSRKLKVEQKQTLKQALMYIGVAVALSIVFLFIILPGLFNLLANFSGKKNIQDTDSGILPQTPVLAAPITATDSATLPIKGFSQKGLEIVILQNAQEAGRTQTGDDGGFTYDVTLEEGENAIAAYAINDKEEESPVSQEYKILLDREPPKIEVSDPQDKQTIQGKQNKMLTVKGTTEPKTKVYLNDRLIFVKEDGTFTPTHRLENGENGLTFKAIDQAGNTTELKLTVTYSE